MPGGEFSMDWSADGRYLLFTRRSAKRDSDIWAMSIADPAAEPFQVVNTEANEGVPQFSPDGKWIAYQSDKLGREEIFIRPFPGPGADTRVSSDGGIQARWNPKTGELFYVSADDSLMAVPVALKPDGIADVGKPEKLFPVNIGSTVRLKYRQQYAVSPDGKSFMLNSIVDAPSAPPIVVMLHWKPGR
jgi:dipeptidyl aminopeptidase/acylaminoacyl peptidase